MIYLQRLSKKTRKLRH